MDQLTAMRVFVRVVEAGSLTRAAESLGIPTGTVSRTLQQLETALGGRLINRTTRSNSLTDDGFAYYSRSLGVLAEIDEMATLISQATQRPKGKMKVNMPSMMANSLLIPALPQFFEKYPDIEVEMGLTDRPVDLVEEGVHCVIRVGELGDSGLIARRIGNVARLTCASPAYLKRCGEPKTLDDLSQHVGINYFSSSTQRVRGWDLEVDGKLHTVTMKSQITVNDATSYVNCSLAGLGIVNASRYALDPYLTRGELREILTDYPSASMPVSVLYSPNRHLPLKVRVFIEWVAELFQQGPALQAGRLAN
ncbi:HTH-type transcriptional regulator DmlR [Paraburkholderia fynbosensis]|uniref:HTH-type transcriptional regulator DmlR n=2 Tax=Paraburkholderia fynbosensis TaxID=1200993 RepID=A0A6J5GTR8_9BURK|nr:HTH-type transcriptional regulator DmlR [Paraburkholderia fynbosensis]